jgi:hypothetical protein
LLKSRPSPDKLEAFVDVLGVTLKFVQLLQRQLIRLDAGQPVAMKEMLAAAELVMLRSSALETQLCGTSCVTQLERYSQPTQPR